jgi:hypothetical protein
MTIDGEVYSMAFFIPQAVTKVEDKQNIKTNAKTSTPLWDEEDPTQGRQETLIVSIRGLQKVGKTHLLMTSVELEQTQFMNFVVKSGKPLYYIDMENAAKIEKDHHFSQYAKDIKIKTPITFDEKGRIDYVKSYVKFKELIDEIFANVDNGILCIDGAGFIADATWFILIDRILGYGFDDFGKPNKKPAPHEYVWRKKEMRELFTKLRFMKVPVFITNKVKKETEPDQEKNFFKFTGSYVEDSIEGTPYYYDMEITLEKVVDGADIKRVAKIYDSRFEEDKIPVLKYTIEDPSMKKIFVRIGEVLLKKN